MITLEELQRARATRWEALRPAQWNTDGLRRLARDLGLASLPELADCYGAETSSDPERSLRTLTELLESEVAALGVIELELWKGERRYIAAELLSYVYVAVGDRHPRQDFKKQAAQRQLSWLAAEVFETMLAVPEPLSAPELRDRMGAERTSTLGIERALAELAATLKVMRVGRREGHGLWRPLVTVLPEVPAQVDSISLIEAAAALLTQWLDVKICDTEENMATFFSPLFSRSRVHAALAGLEAGREVLLDSLEGRHAFRLRSAPEG